MNRASGSRWAPERQLAGMPEALGYSVNSL